ncbi:AT-hook motif nuclear-localized protein 23-like [Zingiber officinale]|uniref:PPC domain-containing protein n=1 Tax=Zingiber officinale TaxID=94328 RepID=A0A8J5FL91_ZINOF|nr:AT-hook motif nuclear-localized protein 23-like [Zingiber officinale]KAG6489689.1 hypothetical protein ZIOFF_050965 [Zingiber officinale]
MAGSSRAPGVMIGLSQPASDGDDDDVTSWPRAVAPDETSPGSSAVRKPRGRPPGSKNKPKQPMAVSRGRASPLHPVVLQFDGGFDIVSGLSDYVRRNRVGVSVLSASGVVSGVSLRHASVAVAHGLQAVFTLQGRFDILSLSGTLFPPSATAFPPGHFFSGTLFPPGVPQPPPLTVSLASSRGQVIAGAMMGSMSAAGPVLIMAATFSNPEFLRLPISDDDNEAAVVDDDDSGADPVTPLATSLPSNLPDLNALPVRLSRNSIVSLAQPSSVRPPPHAHPPPPRY